MWTEVWTNLRTVSPYKGPPPPPLHLGFGGGPEPDYPPSTCYVQVVWLGSWCSYLQRGRGRDNRCFGLESGSVSEEVVLGVKVKVKGSDGNGSVNDR